MSELELNSLEEWQKAELLVKSARNLFLEGRTKEAQTILSEAVEIARQGENSSSEQSSIDSSSLLWEIAEELAFTGEFEKAQEVAFNIKNQHKSQRAQHFVAEIAEGRKGSFIR